MQGPRTVAAAVVLIAAIAGASESNTQKKAGSGTGRRAAPASSGKLSVAWVGQDGHDLVGPSSALEPSGIQDMHFVLNGLPAGREIEFVSIKGYGGDEWQFEPRGSWRAAFVFDEQKTKADVYVEPSRVETGRVFEFSIRFKDGTTESLLVGGGKADPGLRMPSAAVAAKWLGQDRQDRTGLGPSVGPDGRQDAHIELSKLAKTIPIDTVTIDGPKLAGWSSGDNSKARNNAEVVRRPDDPSKADLFFQPDGNLAGAKLKVTVHYAKTTPDSATVTCTRTDPKLAMPRPAPANLAHFKVKSRWLGQDGVKGTSEGAGDVHVLLDGLPAKRVVWAIMSNGSDAMWDWRTAGSRVDWSFPMTLRQSPEGTGADLFFAPDRDESGGVMTLRLGFADGQTAFTQFPGGTCDPVLRCLPPAATKVVAKPGDRLPELAARFGSVHLSSGVYRLDAPWVLKNPVHVTADKGATLTFTQAAGAPPWTTAIKILSGRTTLEGFAIRFDGPIRWNSEVQWGPAIIGSSDNLDTGAPGTVAGIVIRALDIEAPPNPGQWAEAPRMMRFMTALNGRIEKNTLKGGTIELRHGPWVIVDNDYRGPVSNTFAQAVFSLHYSQDLLLARNRIVPTAPTGKAWRFLVLTHYGSNDAVRENVVSNIGPRDDDTIPHPNAPEVILTESYRLHFEGQPAAVSSNGWVLQIPPPQESPARVGDVVAILTGPKAGEWRRIAQAIDAQTYLMEAPLPTGEMAISMAAGFVNTQFVKNRVESRGSSIAVNMVLVGNHFGTRVTDNEFIGGRGSFLIGSFATEEPVHWGWSHTPVFGAVVERNTLEDALEPASVAVMHGTQIKSNRGRVYMSVELKDNVARWSDRYPRSATKREKPVGLNIGDEPSIDPGELVVKESGTKSEIGAGREAIALRVRVGRVNGKDRGAAVAEKRK
jgi:hypothetical protein